MGVGVGVGVNAWGLWCVVKDEETKGVQRAPRCLPGTRRVLTGGAPPKSEGDENVNALHLLKRWMPAGAASVSQLSTRKRRAGGSEPHSICRRQRSDLSSFTSPKYLPNQHQHPQCIIILYNFLLLNINIHV